MTRYIDLLGAGGRRDAREPVEVFNRRRFNAYFECHRKLTGLLEQAIELGMLTCGMKREGDWVLLLIAQMQHDGAKSRTNVNQDAVED